MTKQDLYHEWKRGLIWEILSTRGKVFYSTEDNTNIPKEYLANINNVFAKDIILWSIFLFCGNYWLYALKRNKPVIFELIPLIQLTSWFCFSSSLLTFHLYSFLPHLTSQALSEGLLSSCKHILLQLS